ncbi:hypothetical protein FNI11_14030 [Salmonella enterica subsp. salamae]|nr:hypothetical protein [Salmonella enterica subsp. salamae]ECJ2281633.1 hypothetical protein [Salmonella enterica subsp. salamae]HCC0889661.1 hypothetical protein [Salmonella enterica]
MLIFSLISVVNSDALPSGRSPFIFDANKIVEPTIMDDDKSQTVQFETLLDQLIRFSLETLNLLSLSIKAVTPRCGEDNTHQLTLFSGTMLLYRFEINEVMKNFLYQHVFDIDGGIKAAFHTVCDGLKSLWQKFTEENSRLIVKEEKALCSPYTAPASVLELKSISEPMFVPELKAVSVPEPVPGKQCSSDEKSLTLDDVLNYKKMQSVFKHELHSLLDSLNVLHDPDAVKRFGEKKAAELALQTGVHTGLSIAGGMLGAVIGSALAPGIGTFIGAGIGAGISWLSKKVYDYTADVVSQKINPNPHVKTQEVERHIKAAEKGSMWGMWAKVKSIIMEPSRVMGILGASLVSLATKEVALPVQEMAIAYYDYGKASEGLTPEKAAKIQALLDKYHNKLQSKYNEVLGYLEENPSPDNLRRKEKIQARDAVIRERVAAIGEYIKKATEFQH